MRFLALALCAVFPVLAQDMYQFSVDQDRLSGAPDFSAMNDPLGPEDRLFVRNGHFYRVGEDRQPLTSDDERVRLYGVNLAFAGNFPEEKDAARIAKRLRKLGVNLVRLHHMDTSPDEEPADARSILTTGPYPTLNPVTVKRLRVFLDALAAEGIYINLNLHVGYRFRPFVDGVPALPDGVEIPTHSKPLHIFYPRMVDLQVEFTRALMQALKLKGDPVLGMVEIDNEASLLFSWQGGRWTEQIAGAYAAELKRQWNDWLRAKYRSSDRLCDAWGGCPHGESLNGGGMSMATIKELDNEQRVNDFLLFLEEADRRYLLRMLAAVRETSDAFVPVAGTQLNFGGPMNFDSHAPLDYQDSHFYIDHYNFPNRSWDSHDWRIRDSSSVGSGLTTFIRLAFYREANRPYTVSEYNQQYPNRQGTEIDVTLAAFGALQDWDSIMHFAYAHNRNWDNPTPSSFDLNGDWAKYPASAQAAWLFRSGAISPAGALLEVPLSKSLKLQATRNRRRNDFQEFLREEHGVTPEIALRHRVAVTHDNSAAAPALAKTAGAAPYESDTGQLVYSPERKRYVIRAERAAGVIGFLEVGETVKADGLEVKLTGDARGFASILVTPLDGKPLAESGHLLLTNPGYVLGTQPGSNPVRPKRMIHYEGQQDWWTLEKDPGFEDRPSGSRNALEPIWMERVESHVTLRTSAGSIEVYPLGGAGERLTPLSAPHVRQIDGGFEIHLQADGQEFSPWYEIRADHQSR